MTRPKRHLCVIGDSETVSRCVPLFSSLPLLPRSSDYTYLTNENPALFPRIRGSPFLKRWMDFLEDQADLRYPNVADLT